MVRKIFGLIILIIAVLLIWWVWTNQEKVSDYLPIEKEAEIITFEKRYYPDELVNGEVELIYHPYLLMDVSYSDGDKQKEALLIWGLNNGEIVRDFGTWAMTDGISESIDLDADQADYAVMKEIEANGGKSSLEDFDQQSVISALKKGLIRRIGNGYALAVPSTYLNLLPKTEVSQPLIKRTYSRAAKKEIRYPEQTLIKTAKEIFGDSLKIKQTEVIYLPVFHTDLKKDNHTIEEISYNALTGIKL